MIVFFNGQFISEENAKVSIFDRSTLYGDGLFESVRVGCGVPFRWSQHLHRMERGAAFLGIRMPLSIGNLEDAALTLIRRSEWVEGILRVHLSRGIGPRGYSPTRALEPWLAMSLHPGPKLDAKLPPQWRLLTSKFRVCAGDPLTQFKTCNKLHHVLARAEADAAGAEEALLLNTSGEVAETTSANLFWMDGDNIFTPPLSSGVLPGITRALVLEFCQELGLPCQERVCSPRFLREATGVFLTLSSWGIVEAIAIDGKSLGRSPWVHKIFSACQAMQSGGSSLGGVAKSLG